MGRHRLVAAVALAIIATSWGAIPLIVREEIPVTHLVASRIWLGGLAVLLTLRVLGRLRLPQLYRGRLIAAGLILLAHWLLFFLAIKETTVAVALAVVYLAPVVVAVLAPRLLGERVGPMAKWGLALAFVGTLLVVRPGEGATLTGVVLAVVAGALMAALMLVAKPAADSLGGLTVAAGELAVAAVFLTPWAVKAAIDSSEFWPQLLILGILFTGVAFVVYWSAMSHLPVTVVGVMMYLEPASALVLAAIVLDERPDLLAWFGVVLVIVGGALAALEVSAKEVAVVPTTL